MQVNHVDSILTRPLEKAGAPVKKDLALLNPKLKPGIGDIEIKRGALAPSKRLTGSEVSNIAEEVTRRLTGPSDDSRKEAEPITVEALQKAWGTSDGRFDLTNDGTVNLFDLLELLHRMGGPNGSEPAPGTNDPAESPPIEGASHDGATLTGADAPAPGTDGGLPIAPETLLERAAVPDEVEVDPADAGVGRPEPELTLDGLLKAWGDGETPYDLNGDKQVNVFDLLQFLAQMDGKPKQNDTGAPGSPANGELGAALTGAGAPVAGGGAASRVPATNAPLPPVGNTLTDAGGTDGAGGPTLDGLLNAWGTADEIHDLNGDGTVNLFDLLAMLHDMDGARDEDAPGAPSPRAVLAQLGEEGPRIGERAADALFAKLQDAGFERQPPENLVDLLDALKLKDGERRETLKQLGEKYPRGLGINLAG